MRPGRILIVSLAAVMLVCLTPALMSSDISSADPDTEVHGITYKGSSILRLAVLPGSGMAYQNIDWYIYHTGDVEIYENGELAETVTSSGLQVVKRTYEIGQSYTVMIRTDGGMSFQFDIRVRSTIDLRDIDRDVQYFTFSEDELLMEYLKVGFGVGLAVAAGFYLMYRHRRNANKKEVRNL